MGRAGQLNTAHQPSEHLTIVVSGGGSGGHITPILAVADEIKKQSPDAEVVFVGQKGDKLQDIPKQHSSIDKVFGIRAGKFRRYHGEGLKQLLDIKTMLKNIRDFFLFIAGLFDSYRLLGQIKPSVVFIKGGYVGVPIGLAAAARKIPFVTHDSDALPGLANRILGRWAAAHAVALPKNVYKYPAKKTFTVGVPISSKFYNVSKEEQAKFKRSLKLPESSQMLLITGGGLGATRLNQAIVEAAPMLLSANQNLYVILVAGRDHENEIKRALQGLLESKNLRDRAKVKGLLVDEIYRYSGAADIVITRAGATSLAEFSAQHKACILVPNPLLTGGHQLKNADYLAAKNAVVTLNDSELTKKPELLVGVIQELLNNPSKRVRLGRAFGEFARPRAAKDLAELIIEQAN